MSGTFHIDVICLKLIDITSMGHCDGFHAPYWQCHLAEQAKRATACLLGKTVLPQCGQAERLIASK
jgi:hypothetical protein